MPKPIFHVLEETVGMRRFTLGSHGEEKCIEQLDDIRFQHQFVSKKLMGKHLYGARSIQLLQNGCCH